VEYLLGLGIGAIFSRNGPSDKPGTIHLLQVETGSLYPALYRAFARAMGLVLKPADQE
jgi:hypothetical protein